MPSSAFSRTASAASLGPCSASWRVTRSSALMPTRSLKALWPWIIGAISVRRKSATALISSVGVGSSCILSAPWSQQPKQINLRLRRAPSDHRLLHRMIRGVAETLHHPTAHDAPAQRTHYLPEHHAIRVDLAARLFVTRKQILAGAKTADGLVDLAKAPGVDADPAEILHGIAEMRDLPVQHGSHAVGADDEIAVAEIAMHQRCLARCARIVIGEPA